MIGAQGRDREVPGRGPGEADTVLQQLHGLQPHVAAAPLVTLWSLELRPTPRVPNRSDSVSQLLKDLPRKISPFIIWCTITMHCFNESKICL